MPKINHFAPLLGLVMVALTACSSRAGGYAPMAQDLLSINERQTYPRTLAEVEAYPYAQLGVQLGDVRPGIAVLAEYEQGNHRWVAADDVSILTTPDGQLLEVRTSDEVTTSVIKSAGGRSWVEQVGSTYQRVVVSSESGERLLRCRVEDAGVTSLTVLGAQVAVQAWREQCADTAGQSERLIYLDDRGRFRGLEGQWYPGAARMRMDVLKVPA